MLIVMNGLCLRNYVHSSMISRVFTVGGKLFRLFRVSPDSSMKFAGGELAISCHFKSFS